MDISKASLIYFRINDSTYLFFSGDQKVNIGVTCTTNKQFLVPANTQFFTNVTFSFLHHPCALPISTPAAGARITWDFEKCHGSILATDALIETFDGVDDPQLMLLLLAVIAC